ncbi:UNVERIFIED_CONTAM: hypothetical protein K2H54_023435 [Gekko kuhli]
MLRFKIPNASNSAASQSGQPCSKAAEIDLETSWPLARPADHGVLGELFRTARRGSQQQASLFQPAAPGQVCATPLEPRWGCPIEDIGWLLKAIYIHGERLSGTGLLSK